jgi:glycosyltransferase involved in cell wall biosynthesis
MNDLIFVSMENWDDVWRRNQFLCATLATRFPAMKILFVGLPVNVSHHVRHGSLGKLRGPMQWTVPGYPNITVTHSLKLLPDSIQTTRKVNEWVARSGIRRTVRALRMRDPILWLNPHAAVHMAGALGERSVVYDITDDWTLMPYLTPAERKVTQEQDHLLAARADLVIVCSEALERSRRDRCRRIMLLPNGVEAKRYEDVCTPPAARVWPQPVFGYTGTMHQDRTDAQIILDLARAFPQGSVVLVGPDHWNDQQRKLLKTQKNVFMPGPVPYRKIPETMAQFDVCIVPHVETHFTDSLNPLKLWEYLAAGTPIVSTNVAATRSRNVANCARPDSPRRSRTRGTPGSMTSSKNSRNSAGFRPPSPPRRYHKTFL